MSTKLSDFDYRIFRRLQSLGTLEGQKVLVACSGGLDSVALVHSLVAISAKLNLTLALGHVHHGRIGEDSQATQSTQSKAREASLELVRDLAKTENFQFYTSVASSELVLTSEESLRDFRKSELSKMALAHGFGIVALAHHADDLLETRLMRLIRGTGAQGLSAMEFSANGLLRPFLDESRDEIRAYAEQNDLRWIEDPSNQDPKYFRNWIRNEWLPQLETKKPGALESLARSLETLSEEFALCASGPAQRGAFSAGKLDRKEFSFLTNVQKRALLVSYVASFKLRDFSRSRVEEVIKRLHHLESTGQKVANFSVGGLQWQVDAFEIRAQASQVLID